MVTIDAKDAVVGRLGARVAKLLLAKQPVELVNADSAVMVGSLSAAQEKYLSRMKQQNKRNPEESPYMSRVPNMFLRRIIRGMLPWKSRRGRDAYKLLKVTRGAPEGVKAQKMAEASSSQKHGTYTLAELCRSLGKE